MKDTNFDAAERRSGEMQILYEEVMQDNHEFRKFIRSFKEKRNRLDLLTQYYSSNWKVDRDIIYAQDEDYEKYTLLSEDPVFNAIEEQIKLMKKLTDLLNQY